MNLTQVATDAFGNTLGESVAAEIMAHRAVARTAAASTKTFAEDHEARTATNPLTNDGARVPGENYRVVTGGSESDFNLVKGLGNLQTAGKLSDDVDNFNALYRGPKVYVIGSYLTPAEKQASIIEERLVAEYGSRANYETVAAAKGARDSAVGSIRGIGGAILGTYRYITGDKATRSAVAEALNRLSSMPAGSILNAVGKGIVDASFVGVAGAFADRNPYAAGAGIGGAASGVLIPFAGSLAAKGLGSITEVEALAKLGLRELPPVRPNVDRMAPGDIRFTQDTKP